MALLLITFIVYNLNQIRLSVDKDSKDSDTTSTLENDAETPRDFEPVQPPDVATTTPWFQSTKILRLLSLILHSTLVVIHLALIGVWAKGLEHHLVFTLENQKLVSLLITAIFTTFGTIYSAVLVLVTQTLSIRRSLQMDQTLTATHDNSAAWAGIGSAIVHVWHQKAVPASVIGVLSTFLYLGNILVLHITTPSLVSLQTFNSSRSVLVPTQSLPAYNWSNDVSFDRQEYLPASLSYLPFVAGTTTTEGLYGGTLYDILDPNAALVPGNVSVKATGFNITCGYVEPGMEPGANEPTGEVWWLNDNGGDDALFAIYPTQPGIISALPVPVNTLSASITLYATVPIIDSNNHRGPLLDLNPPMKTEAWDSINDTTYMRVSSVQAFRCSQSLVPQTAFIDSQSRNLLAVEPALTKSTSTWLPYAGLSVFVMGENETAANLTTSGNFLLDTWAYWYDEIPSSYLALDSHQFPVQYVTTADKYLIEQLDLPGDNSSKPLRSNVTLHDVENILSALVASMFWTRHVSPADSAPTLRPYVPFLLKSNVTADVVYLEVRVELAIIAVSVGLVASIALLLLSLPYSLLHRDKENDRDLPLDGTGILHAMWLYRNHPELETLLEQVEHPTNDNLRSAGMVRTRLVGGRWQMGKRGHCESCPCRCNE
ncbi:hypothetical protein FB451DRAFT_1517922 [Mycena latifolia]|nr:hypothetical protein FB451DRAFT_1517922 [Mycena latifolia]